MKKLAKRISGEEKLVIVKSFTEGKTVDKLAIEFVCTKATIARNLKLNLGPEKYKELINKKKAKNKSSNNYQKNISVQNKDNLTKIPVRIYMTNFSLLIHLLKSPHLKLMLKIQCKRIYHLYRFQM